MPVRRFQIDSTPDNHGEFYSVDIIGKSVEETISGLATSKFFMLPSEQRARLHHVRYLELRMDALRKSGAVALTQSIKNMSPEITSVLFGDDRAIGLSVTTLGNAPGNADLRGIIATSNVHAQCFAERPRLRQRGTVVT